MWEGLSKEKGRTDEYQLYANVERLATQLIAQERKIYKGVSANVDFYSGFIYSMLDLPMELYTPIFAIARIAGWSAHRMEELIGGGKIIRPAYMAVQPPPGLPPGLNKNIPLSIKKEGLPRHCGGPFCVPV